MTLLKELPKTETPGRLAAHITHNVIPLNRSGFTLDPLTATSPVFDDDLFPEVYYVSKLGYEQKFDSIPSYKQVYQWIVKKNYQLQIPNNHIGFWHHEGRYYLDVTKPIAGLRNAVAFGKLNRQLSIYHPYSRREIEINGTAVSGGAA